MTAPIGMIRRRIRCNHERCGQPNSRVSTKAVHLAIALLLSNLGILTAAQTPEEEPSAALNNAIGDLIAAWPASADDCADVLGQIDAIYSEFAQTFPDAIGADESYNPQNWARRQTPQYLARRRATLVQEAQGMVKGYSAPGTPYARTPGCFVIRLKTPEPSSPGEWNDLLVLNATRDYVLAVRPLTDTVCREFVLMDWSTGTWRAINGAWYPDGSPERLWCCKDGAPNVHFASWDTAGAYRGGSILDGQFAGEALAGVTTLSIAFSAPEVRESPTDEPPADFPVPYAAIYITPVGELRSIVPPRLPGREFTGWGGDARGPLRNVVLDGNASKRLVAHYAWYSVSNGYLHRIEPALENEWRRITGKPDGVLSTHDTVGITTLDLARTQFKNLEELRLFRQLKRLDLTGIPIWNVYPLTRFAAIESVLIEPAPPHDPGLFNKVLLALHAGLAPPIEHLTLNDTELAYVGDLAFLTGVEVLNLSNARITDLRFVPTMTSLKALDVSYNEIPDLSPLVDASLSLTSINLSGNQVAALDTLLARDTWPPDFVLDLRGNALAMDALCGAVPELVARGVTLYHDGKCVSTELRRADVDNDGDGYSEADEWRFVALFSADEAEREARYDAAIQDPKVPAEYLALLTGAGAAPGKPVPLDAIPTTRIDISIKGRGTAYPGPGTHEFARFVFNEDHTRSDNQITITPKPEPGWAYVPWNESSFVGGGVKRAESGNDLVFNMSGSVHAQFEFARALAPLDIDLVDALVKFVSIYYPDEDPYVFDKNDLSYHENRVGRPAPNGMPDAAEFRLLQAILQSPTYDYIGHYGTSFDDVMAIWNANLPIARRALGEIAEKEPHILHVLCAYATLGGYTSRGAATAMLHDLKGLDIDPNQFKDGRSDLLAPDRGIRDRAARNKELWRRVSSRRTVGRAVIDAYAELVLSQPRP